MITVAASCVTRFIIHLLKGSIYISAGGTEVACAALHALKRHMNL